MTRPVKVLSAIGLLAAVPAHAVVTLGSSNSVTVVAAASVNLSLTSGGTNRLVLVGVSMGLQGGSQTVSGVTYNGVALVPVCSLSTSGAVRTYIYRTAAEPAATTANVVVTMNGPTGPIIVVGAASFRGVDLAAPIGTCATTPGNTATVSSATGELVFGVGSSDAALTPGAGQTQLWSTGGSLISKGMTKPGAASVSMSWTGTGNRAHAAVPIKQTFSVPTKLGFIVQPSNTMAGASISPAVQVAVQDDAGTTMTSSTASITLDFGSNPGAGTLSGTRTVSAVNGIATFSNLSINKSGTGFTLVATSSGLTLATSSAFNITAGAASKLAFTVQPSNTVAGVDINPDVRLTVQDVNGNTVTSSTASVTLAIANNPGGGTLTGSNPVTASAGVAVYGSLNINKTGNGYTLTASAAGLTGATSAAFNITPGAATKLAFTAQPTNTIANVGISPNVQVTVRDANDNTVTSSAASITLAIGTNPGGGVLSGTNPVSASSGVATFSNLSIDKVGTGYTLTANAAGLTGTTSTAFNISIGAATKLAFTIQPGNTTAGVTISPAVQVTVQDAGGNTVTSSTASISVAIGANPGGGTLLGTSPVSASGGLASFSNLSINKSGTGYTLVATAAGLTSATSTAFNIVAGTATDLAFSVQPSNATAGASISPAVLVTVRDSNGNTVTSSTASITLAIGANPGGGTLTGTNPISASSGVATFSNLAINKSGVGYTLVATAAGLAGATSSTFNIAPGAATKLAFTVQPTNATAGASISPAVQVTVRDANDNTVTSSTASIALAFGANPGGGTLSGTNPVPASGGVATFSNLSINAAGTGYTLVASSGALAAATSAAFNIVAGTGNQVKFTVQPSNAAAGSTINPAIQVQVQDNLGNLITGSTASITLAIGANPGGGALSGLTTVSAVGGIATFSTVSIDKSGTGYTLIASSAGFTSDTSSTFNISAGAAAKLAFTVQPSNAVAGASIAPAIQVTVQDTNGNTVATSSASITLAIGANPGGGALSGTNPLSASSGVGTFSNISINKVGSGYTLIATASGLTAATSGAFNISVGAAAKLAFTVQPSSATAGGSISPAVQVAVRDANDNLVPTSTASITLAIGANPGGGALSGTNPVSAGGGIATYSNLAINKTGNGYTLTASAAGLTAATSTTFNISAGAATKLAFAVQPTNAIAGASISPAVQVVVRDANDNLVTTSTASIALAIGANPGGGALSGTTPVSASGGVATFSNMSINKSGVGYTLAASAGGLTGATSTAFNVAAGTATKLTFTVQPSNAAASASISPAVQVSVADINDNVVTSSSAVITLAIGANPGAGTLSGTSSVAANSGVASFSNLSINRIAVGYTLTASAGGLTGTTSAAFDVTAGAPTRLVFTGQPTDGAAGAAISPAVQVTVQDAGGNTVTASSALITVAIAFNPSGGTLSGTTTLAAVSGLASLSNLSINLAGTGYTLAASSPGLTSATSTSFKVTAVDDLNPIIVRDAVLTGAVGVAYPYNAAGRVLVNGAPPMTFSPCDGPAGFNVDAQTGDVTWIPTAAGIVSLCVAASNDYGVDTYTFFVTISSAPVGQAPTASFTVTPPSGAAPFAPVFDASASTCDPSTSIVGYQWSYGDSSPIGYGITSSHGYLVPGGVVARLTVVDGYGRTASMAQPIAVGSGALVPPTAQIVASALSGDSAALPVTFSCNCQPGSAPIVSYAWDFGPGASTAAAPSYVFVPGGYHVRLTVVDANGLTGTDSVLIVVSSSGVLPPSCRATVTPASGPAPLLAHYLASFHSQDGSPALGQWSFWDASTAVGPDVLKALLDPGYYSGRLIVTDGQGLTCMDLAVAVALGPNGEVPPNIVSTPPRAAACGVRYAYAPLASGPGPLVWSVARLDGAPLQAGLAVNSSTGELTWTPRGSNVGSLELVLQASNGVSTGVQRVTLDVTCGAMEGYGVACGCGAGGDRSAWAILACAAVLVGLRRRRRVYRASATGAPCPGPRICGRYLA